MWTIYLEARNFQKKKNILSILGSIARERFTFDFQKENILSIEPRVVNDTLNREQKGNGKSLR